MSDRPRVVVTGLGVVSPVGCSVEEAWRNAVEGRSGITPIRHFDAANYPTRIAGTVQGFDPGGLLPERERRRMDPFTPSCSAMIFLTRLSMSALLMRDLSSR